MKQRPNAYYGWNPDHPDSRDHLFDGPRLALPRRVDLREGCSPIDDQGALGSCTAHALTGALEFLERKHGRTPTDLSRLFIYYNERAIEGTVHSDAGARLRDGIKSLAKQGVCAETSWPYKPQRFATKPSTRCFSEADQHRIASYERLLTLKDMRACLAAGYPFVFGFTVYESFESDEVARTGQAQLPGSEERALGGHAVMAVGYDDRARRFMVRNSWGTAWGIGGYFTMPYAYLDTTGLADDFWTVRAFDFA